MLTKRQQQILAFIRQYLIRSGYPPTFREIAEGVGLRSTNSVTHQLGQLEERGLIEREPGVYRGLRLLDAA